MFPTTSEYHMLLRFWYGDVYTHWELMVWMNVYAVVFISLPVALNQVHLPPLIKEVHLIYTGSLQLYYNVLSPPPPPISPLSLRPPSQNVPQNIIHHSGHYWPLPQEWIMTHHTKMACLYFKAPCAVLFYPRPSPPPVFDSLQSICAFSKWSKLEMGRPGNEASSGNVSTLVRIWMHAHTVLPISHLYQ